MTWKRIDCQQRDALYYDSTGRAHLHPLGGRSDLGGEFGDPRIETIWGDEESGAETLKDVRHPRYEWDSQEGDREPCEHYEWNGGDQP